MESVKGEVVSLLEKNKNYFVELDNGMKLSGWLNKMPENLVEGGKYLFGYTKNGQYNNIDSVTIITAGANVTYEDVVDAPAKQSPKPIVSLKVEVIESNNKVEFQDVLNQFGSTHKVEFTQTHIVALSTAASSTLIYSAVVWYREL